MSGSLRKSVIRLAYENPEIQSELLKVLACDCDEESLSEPKASGDERDAGGVSKRKWDHSSEGRARRQKRRTSPGKKNQQNRKRNLRRKQKPSQERLTRNKNRTMPGTRVRASDLHKAMTRLAYENPELRPHLLPILARTEDVLARPDVRGASYNSLSRAPRSMDRNERELVPIFVEPGDYPGVDGGRQGLWYFHQGGDLYGPYRTELDAEHGVEAVKKDLRAEGEASQGDHGDWARSRGVGRRN